MQTSRDDTSLRDEDTLFGDDEDTMMEETGLGEADDRGGDITQEGEFPPMR